MYWLKPDEQDHPEDSQQRFYDIPLDAPRGRCEKFVCSEFCDVTEK